MGILQTHSLNRTDQSRNTGKCLAKVEDRSPTLGLTARGPTTPATAEVDTPTPTPVDHPTTTPERATDSTTVDQAELREVEECPTPPTPTTTKDILQPTTNLPNRSLLSTVVLKIFLIKNFLLK